MKAREFNPLRLNVAGFAAASGSLAGEWPLSSLKRLAACAHPQAQPGEQGRVSWAARGEARAKHGNEPEIWLHLQARTQIALECQRCLQPWVCDLDVERSVRFVADENQASALDAESEDDVLALTNALDMRTLIEDELLLALPIVPKHEVCPEPLPVPSEPAREDEAGEAQSPNPFAALAALKRSGGSAQ